MIPTSHISRQSGLVTDSGWNTTQQGGHLSTGLSESEDIVDEEKHILVHLITEIFSERKTGKSDTLTSTCGGRVDDDGMLENDQYNSIDIFLQNDYLTKRQ